MLILIRHLEMTTGRRLESSGLATRGGPGHDFITWPQNVLETWGVMIVFGAH